MKTISSADGKVLMELRRLGHSFDLVQDPWDSGAWGVNQSSKLIRWDEANNNSTIPSGKVPIGYDTGQHQITLVTVARATKFDTMDPDAEFASIASLYFDPDGGNEDLINIGFTLNNDNTKDGNGNYRGVYCSGDRVATDIHHIGNADVTSDFVVIAFTLSASEAKFYLNGVEKSFTLAAGLPAEGVKRVDAPGFLVGHHRDNASPLFYGWPQIDLATLMVFGRTLSGQEIRDLTGMFLHGAGKAVSRANLDLWWIAGRARSDSHQITPSLGPLQSQADLPLFSLPAWNAVRYDDGGSGAHDIAKVANGAMDWSGRSRFGSTYFPNDISNEQDMENLVAGGDPGIWIPQKWSDSDIKYDGVNDYTKSLLETGSTGPEFH